MEVIQCEILSFKELVETYILSLSVVNKGGTSKHHKWKVFFPCLNILKCKLGIVYLREN